MNQCEICGAQEGDLHELNCIVDCSAARRCQMLESALRCVMAHEGEVGAKIASLALGLDQAEVTNMDAKTPGEV